LKSNEFAYFKKTFKKEYLRYKEFINKMTDPNRSYNYYFAQETLPRALQKDIGPPHLVEPYLKPTTTAFWHGVGTLSLPHTDGDENMMCVFKGYKNFTIVPPWHSKFVYAGETRPR
jgi:hypothetical protein